MVSNIDPLVLLDTGVVGAAILGGYYIGKIVMEWWRQRGEDIEQDSVRHSRHTGDLVAVNSALKGNLADAHARNNELGDEVADLRRQNLELWKQLRQQREYYEAQIADLQAQATDFARQLANLQVQIQRGHP